MACLVTGGTGLIGSRIVRDLAKEGEPVVVYDIFPNESLLEHLLDEEGRARVRVIQGDVTDLPHLVRTVKENKVDIIFHLAGLLSEVSEANPAQAVKTNCEGTVNIFESARLLGVKKVVWASSILVFGPAERYASGYIPNDGAHYPQGVYGACKSFNENMADHYFEHYGVDISAIRYSTVYGAGQTRGTSGTRTRELVLNPALGKPGRVPFGDDIRSWLYVDDAARATVMVSRVPRTRTRAFTLMGENRPIREVADYVRKLLPGADITLLPGCAAAVGKFETAPIEREIGYRPQWSMEQGIKAVINITRRQHGLPPV